MTHRFIDSKHVGTGCGTKCPQVNKLRLSMGHVLSSHEVNTNALFSVCCAETRPQKDDRELNQLLATGTLPTLCSSKQTSESAQNTNTEQGVFVPTQLRQGVCNSRSCVISRSPRRKKPDVREMLLLLESPISDTKCRCRGQRLC